MNKANQRILQVIRKTYVTPNMLRVTLGGSNMQQFPADQASAYIKLLFPRGDDQRPIARTYTIRAQRDNEIDIDFAVHAESGPALSWALNSQAGEDILIGGPGPKKLANPSADWFLIVGDMTALPAISINLAQLPEDAQGHALIQVLSADDIQPLQAPEGITLHWQINPEPGLDETLLLEKVKTLPCFNGTPYIWCACEMNSMRQLRTYFRAQPQVQRDQMYISSYWKKGVREEEHKSLKSRLDQDAA